MILYHTKKIMEENKIEYYVNMLVQRALDTNKELGYEETSKLTGEETFIDPDAVLRTWPELTAEEADRIAITYNSKVEEAKMERAAEKYAKDGVTQEEVAYQGESIESNTVEASQDREEDQK